MSDQVGNPEDRFSHNEAHLVHLSDCFSLVLVSTLHCLHRSFCPIHVTIENNDSLIGVSSMRFIASNFLASTTLF